MTLLSDKSIVVVLYVITIVETEVVETEGPVGEAAECIRGKQGL